MVVGLEFENFLTTESFPLLGQTSILYLLNKQPKFKYCIDDSFEFRWQTRNDFLQLKNKVIMNQPISTESIVTPQNYQKNYCFLHSRR